MSVRGHIIDACADCARYVFYENRLKSRMWRSQWYDRKPVNQLREQIEEIVVTAKDDRRPEYGGSDAIGLRRAYMLFSRRFRAQVFAGRIVTGLECRNVNQPRHCIGATCVNDTPRQIGVNPLKISFRVLMENSGETDHHIASGDHLGQRARLIDARFDYLNVGEHDEFMLHQFAPSCRNAHGEAKLGQLAGNTAPNESRSAYDTYCSHHVLIPFRSEYIRRGLLRIRAGSIAA